MIAWNVHIILSKKKSRHKKLRITKLVHCNLYTYVIRIIHLLMACISEVRFFFNLLQYLKFDTLILNEHPWSWTCVPVWMGQDSVGRCWYWIMVCLTHRIWSGSMDTVHGFHFELLKFNFCACSAEPHGNEVGCAELNMSTFPSWKMTLVRVQQTSIAS